VADDIGTYRQALEDMLKDRGNDAWLTEELDAAIQLALADLAQRTPREESADLTLAQSGRKVSLSSIAGYLWLEEVWWPYEEGEYPARAVPFEVRDGELTLHTSAEPRVGETVHVLYAAAHAISGLDGATETTVPAEVRGVLVLGAAGYAALAKAAAMGREYAWPTTAAAVTRHWGETMLALFQARLKALRSAAAQAWVTWG